MSSYLKVVSTDEKIEALVQAGMVFKMQTMLTGADLHHDGFGAELKVPVNADSKQKSDLYAPTHAELVDLMYKTAVAWGCIEEEAHDCKCGGKCTKPLEEGVIAQDDIINIAKGIAEKIGADGVVVIRHGQK